MYMIKKAVAAIASAAVALSCASCAENPAQTDGSVKIYCSFYAMAELAREVAGDTAEIEALVPFGAEPHDWEPSVGDIKNLSDGGVFIYHGAGMEDWADSVIESIDTDNCTVVCASEGIDENGTDPHMWLDPKNAQIEAANICSALSAAYPDNADIYIDNLNEFIEETDALYEEFSERLAPFAGKKLITSHAAYGYLCSAFGLEQESVTGIYSEGEPTPARMAELIELMSAENIGAVFCESAEDTSVAETVAKAAGAVVLDLNSMERDTSGGGYAEIMRVNLDNIIMGLSQA